MTKHKKIKENQTNEAAPIAANDYYYKIRKVEDAPMEFKNDERFEPLLEDPAHFGHVVPGCIREAMAIMRAEDNGLIKAKAVRPDIPEIDFYDGDGKPYDVKTPPSPPSTARYPFDYYTAGESILSQIRKDEKNLKTGKLEDVNVLLDTSYLKDKDRSDLFSYIKENASEQELKRITEVKIDFSKTNINSKKILPKSAILDKMQYSK
jgi:hypothetical protein